MKKLNIKLKSAFAVIIALGAVPAICAFFYARSLFVPFLILWLAITLCAVFALSVEYAYTDGIMAQLSELIASISSLEGLPVVTEYEDSLLSKLQSQAVKLTEMLLDQNKQINKEKSDIKALISDISHQLKTPVATLRTYGELLLENGDTEENRAEYLAAFSTALEKLSFLTDSMVKLSRLESGIIVLNPHRACLNDTVLSAVKQVYRKAREKNIELIFDSDKTIVSLDHDEKWTEEAIFNILDNAVKYTPGGGTVTISLSAFEMFARLDIADTGIGISPEEQPKIFGRFYRGVNTDAEEGVGIGLYLARKIISGQGGYIKVKSDKTGSIFSVMLPL